MCYCQNWKSYNFNVRSYDQIDYELIESELTHKNPVMFVSVDGIEGVRVLVHESIWNKAEHAGKVRNNDPNAMYRRGYNKLVGQLLDLMDRQDSDGFVTKETAYKIVDLVKRIKRSGWRDKKRARVTVRKIDVTV